MSDSNSAAVHTEHLSKVYKDFWGRDKVRALEDLSLTIERGEVFGLLGPNGSGKSTTIKLLLGLIFPSAGTATILGQPTGSTVINEKIGFLPEESYLYRFLNGEEILHFLRSAFQDRPPNPQKARTGIARHRRFGRQGAQAKAS